jgi:hypothetical protein
MKKASLESAKHTMKASTKNLDSEDGKFIVVYCDDHSKLQGAATYGASKKFLEARDYKVPELFRFRRGQVSGDKLKVAWDLKWNQFKAPLGSDSDGLSAKDCEIYSVLRGEWRYLDDGYKKLPSKYDAVHGLDGLFQKGNRYLILESKFVTPAKYKEYCEGHSPLPHLGWAKDVDPSYKKTVRQMSWRWVYGSFLKMETQGRDDATQDQGYKMSQVSPKNIDRALNVFGARPVHPPAGAYGFKLQVAENAATTDDLKKAQADAASLEVGWHPEWLYSGKPYHKKEFWILDENERFIFAVRENALNEDKVQTKSSK